MRNLKMKLVKKLPDGRTMTDSQTTDSIIDILVHASWLKVFDRVGLYYLAMGVVVTDHNGIEWSIERV